MKKRDRLTNDLQEVSAEDRKNKLETLSQELQTVDSRVHEIKSQTKGEECRLEIISSKQLIRYKLFLFTQTILSKVFICVVIYINIRETTVVYIFHHIPQYITIILDYL